MPSLVYFLLIIVAIIVAINLPEISAARGDASKIKYCGKRFDQWRDRVFHLHC
jgi:hypothetical protein